MNNYDPDKTRFHSTEEGYNPGYVVGSLRKQIADLGDMVDLIYKSNAMRISKERYHSSKDYLNAFETTMLAYRDSEPIGRLTNEQQREILVMVDDVLKGKRECVHFQISKSGNALREVFSSKIFEFEHNTKQDKE